MTKRLVILTALAVLMAVVSTHRSVFGQVFAQKDKSGRSPVVGRQAAIFNSRLAIQVASDGRFNMGAFPNPVTGGGQAGSFDLMYRWPETPSTSFSTIRIDGANFRYGSSGVLVEPPTNIDSATNRSKWQIGDIEVTQIVQLVFNNQTGQEDAARISYTLRNTGTASHTVGERVMIDTEINQNDGAPYRIPGAGIITTETEFLGSAVPSTFQAFFNVTDGQHVAAGTMVGGGATAPDRFVLARWPQINVTDYDYVVTPGVSFTSDSAYAVYWNPTALAAGGSRTYVTYYGLSDVGVNLEPPLALGVSAPVALSLVNNQYSPNPFDVVATVFNNGNATATNVQLTISLPAGLSLAGGSTTQSVGDLSVGQERQVSWSVRAAPQSSQTTLTYSVTASASNAQPKTVQRQISIPALVQLQPLIFIPGNPGSTLDTTLQDNTNLNLWPGFLEDHDLLTLDPQENRLTIFATDAIRSGVYGPLLEMFVNPARGGYREYQLNGDPSTCDLTQQANHPSLFVFPYDWRKSNAENVAALESYVGCVRQFYPDSNVNIVTHSMGSLLARRYILDNLGAHHVNRLITIGAPWLGAPKAINVMETGDFLNGKSRILAFKSTIKRLVEFFPGVHELLPSRSYFTLGGLPFTEDGWDINGDDKSAGNYTYNQLVDLLDQRFPHSTSVQPFSTPGTNARIFHDYPGQDDWRFDQSGVQYYHIIGRKSVADTIGNVTAKAETSCFLGIFQCKTKNILQTKVTLGDGTVPLLSTRRTSDSSNLNAPDSTLITFSGLNSAGDKLVEHLALTETTAVHDRILSILQGTPLSSRTPLHVRITVNEAEPPAQPANYIKMTGLASVTVADTFGNSSNPLNDESDPGVPGATISNLGTDSILVITPSDQIYTITFRSVGDPMNIELLRGTDTTTTQATRYLDLALPSSVNAQIRITPSGFDLLRYDSNGDGTFDTPIYPTVSVSGDLAQDTTPPDIRVNATIDHASTSVTLTAQDIGVGVRSLLYSLDGTQYQPYVGRLNLDRNQTHTLYAFADDNVGNRSGLVTYKLQPPAILCSENINVVAPLGQSFVTVNYPPPSVNIPNASVVCSPPSGSSFPLGTTAINCTATDASGNTSSCTFMVTAFSFCLQDETNVGNVVLGNAEPSSNAAGSYVFLCGGVAIASGQGTLTVRGGIGSLQHVKGDRRVLIQWDLTAQSGRGIGTAIVQSGSITRCQITDRDMSNNNCSSSGSLSADPKK